MKTQIQSALQKVFVQGEVVNKEGGICFLLIAVPVVVLVLVFGHPNRY